MSNRPWLNRSVQERRLFNPGPAFEHEFVPGVWFAFPAVDEHYKDPVTGEVYPEPGVLPVRIRATYVHWDMSTTPPTETRKLWTDKEVIDYFLGDDGKGGKLGPTRAVRELSPNGDPSIDDVVKAEATREYREVRERVAQANIRAHEQSNTVRRERGLPDLPPSPQILDDFKFLADRERNAPRFGCGKCAMKFVSVEGLREHVDTYHPVHAEELLKEYVPKKKGRPRKVAA